MFMNKSALFLTTIDVKSKSGGGVYTNSIIKRIPSYCDITLIELYRNQKPLYHIFRKILSVFKSFLSGKPSTVIYHSGLLGKEINWIFQKSWDIVFFDHLETTLLLDKLNYAKSVYISHNIEFMVSRYKFPSFLFLLAYYEGCMLKRYEISIIKKTNAVISISQDEINFYKKYNLNSLMLNPTFDPYCKELISSHVDDSNILKIGFLGSRYWKPNYIAMSYFINKICPLLKIKCKVLIVGKGWSLNEVSNITNNSLNTNNPNVEFIPQGFVDKLDDFWSEIDIFLAPITSGAGVNVKVCEALHYGIHVVGSEFSFRGIDIRADYKDLVHLTCNDNDFAKFINNWHFSNLKSKHHHNLLSHDKSSKKFHDFILHLLE